MYGRLIKTIKKSKLYEYRLNRKINKVIEIQNIKVEQLKTRNTIKVIFMVTHDSIWKYDVIYKLLEKNPKFVPQIVIIPLVNKGKPDMLTYNQSLRYFNDNGYNVISSFNQANGSWSNIKKKLKPDVVFFTNPHKITFKKYYINYYKDTLNCYTPYAFVVIHSIEIHYDLDFHHYLWKYFLETNYHKKFYNKYKKQNNKSGIVVGYPGVDSIFSPDYIPRKQWKITTKKTKKIIWAPHHSIIGQGSGLDYSSFIEYSEYFIQLLKDREDIQIIFKPHPFLKEKLYKDDKWGKEKTNAYYTAWDDLPNGQLETGQYIDIFFHSDAMILDCASFLVEYMYFDKPMCFTLRDSDVLERFNNFGQLAFKYVHCALGHLDLENFINYNVVMDNDSLKSGRNKFLQNTVLSSNGKTASENIYNLLVEELC